MNNQDFVDKEKLTIQDLYPDLSREELEQADENLTCYVEVVLRIYERIRSDETTYALFKALTKNQ